MRELRKVNGRAAAPELRAGCLDPKSGALEPLAFLLPHHRDDYTFAWNGVGRLKDRRTMMLDYKPRTAGPIEAKWKGDCVSIDAPGRTKGRIWIDETTHDVLRLDEQLTGQFEYRVPREHWGVAGPQTWVIERADSSIRYRPVAFTRPGRNGAAARVDRRRDGVQRGAVVPDRADLLRLQAVHHRRTDRQVTATGIGRSVRTLAGLSRGPSEGGHYAVSYGARIRRSVIDPSPVRTRTFLGRPRPAVRARCCGRSCR